MKKPQEAHILTLMVDNEFGVLTRITSQIRREGWNIKSLAVAECQNPATSRITLVMECFDTTLPNAIHRLSRLACVRSVTACDYEQHVLRELALVETTANDAAAMKAAAAGFGAQIISEKENKLTFELAGEPKTLDEFVAALMALGEITIARTGPIVLE